MQPIDEYFVHQNAICESSNIGKGTRIWAFSHILPHARIGVNCNICDNVFIENDVIVGNRVTIENGVQLWDGVRLEDDVFIGPNATFTNDPFPRSKRYPDSFAVTVVKKGASVGANSTVLPGVTIGRNAMVGAGAVVTRSVPSNAVVVGNPASIIGYDLSGRFRPEPFESTKIGDRSHLEVAEFGVGGSKVYRFPSFVDMRGSLSVSEFDRDLPFIPRRHFVVFGVPSGETRGEHARRTCHQLLVCIHGSVNVIADDGVNSAEIVLDHPALGLYIPPMIWGIVYRYSKGAVLLVLASHPYDSDDYIREYDDFISVVGSRKPTT